jgi:hypothetical protein
MFRTCNFARIFARAAGRQYLFAGALVPSLTTPLVCSQYISSMYINEVITLIFRYYDLPKFLKATSFQAFGRSITNNHASILKSDLLRFVTEKFGGKCRARRLWNVLQSNGAIGPTDLLPLIEVNLLHVLRSTHIINDVPICSL